MKFLQQYRREAVRVALNFAVLGVFLAHSSGVIKLPLLGFLENYAYDKRMVFSMKSGQDPRIVIVDIDEESLAADGRWPWSRDKMATMLDNLFDKYHVSVVGFDVLFAEPDTSSGYDTLKVLSENELRDDPLFQRELEGVRERLDYDGRFARSMEGRPVVLGFYFSTAAAGSSATRSGVLPAPLFAASDLPGPAELHSADGYGANLPLFQSSAAGGGHFNPWVDPDGIVRRIPLLLEFEGAWYESLALAIGRRVLGADKVEPVFVTDVAGNYSKLEELRLGRMRIPVDGKAQALVTYRGVRGGFPYVSASEVLHGTADSEILEDAIVLVGTSAPGLFDLRATPVQNKYPGVEIHANVIAGMLDGDIKQRPEHVDAIEFIAMVLVGGTIIISIPFLAPLWSMVLAAVLMTASVGANYAVWQQGNTVVPIAATVVLILLQFLINMSYGFFFERRNKGLITDLFGQYVPPELVEEMSENPGAYIREADEREMTVLFSDVRGFTTLSEGLTPKELSELMNEFLTHLTGVIHHHRGTIDKYMGDAIMAFWGAPVRDPEHARHALHAGLAMVEKMYALQDDFEKRGWPRLAIGVGLNTGVMSVGNMGSKFRTAYTVIGDEVNLGSRLEGLTKQYGVELIVGENLVKSLPEYVFRELDLVQVKGKNKPISIYEPLGEKSEVSTEELEELNQHRKVLEVYRSQQWDQAEVQFKQLQQQYGDRELYEIYLDRIDFFRKNPPGPDWDGVFVFTVK